MKDKLAKVIQSDLEFLKLLLTDNKEIAMII